MVVLSMSSPAFSMRAISAGSTKKKSFPSTYEVRAGSSRPERAPRRKRRTSPGRISRDVWLTGARNLDPYSVSSSPRTSCSADARARGTITPDCAHQDQLNAAERALPSTPGMQMTSGLRALIRRGIVPL